ncbi:MAG: hypothetical protein ACFFCW_19870 [Candidatus Hodarchaeota archaeon]
MALKDLSLNPQHFRNPNAWYYEEEKGIVLVSIKSPANVQILIPWKKLEKSLERYKKK